MLSFCLQMPSIFGRNVKNSQQDVLELHSRAVSRIAEQLAIGNDEIGYDQFTSIFHFLRQDRLKCPSCHNWYVKIYIIKNKNASLLFFIKVHH